MSTLCRFCGSAVRPDSMYCPSCGQVAGAFPPAFGAGAPGADGSKAQEHSPAVLGEIPPVPLPSWHAPAAPHVSQPAVPVTNDVVAEPHPEAPQVSRQPEQPEQPPAPPSPPVPPQPVVATVLVLPTGERLPLDRIYTLGRAPEKEAVRTGTHPVRLTDPEMMISRVHLVVQPAQGGALVTDTGSANGSVLIRGGVRTPLAPGNQFAIAPGDLLECGSVILTVA